MKENKNNTRNLLIDRTNTTHKSVKRGKVSDLTHEDQKELEIRKTVDLIKPHLIEKGLNLNAESKEQRLEYLKNTCKEGSSLYCVSDIANESVNYLLTSRNGIHYLLIKMDEYERKLYPNLSRWDPKNVDSCVDQNIIYYRILFNDKGKVLIDLDKVDFYYGTNKNSGVGYQELYNYVFLDDTNILIPTMVKTTEKEKENYYTHYKVGNNGLIEVYKFPKAVKIDSFHDYLDIKSLNENGFIEYNGGLYNYKKGELSDCPKFDEINTRKSSDLEGYLYHFLDGLNLDKKKLVNYIREMIEENNLMVGFKEINVKRAGIEKEYRVFAYLDKDAKILGNIFYVEDGELRKVAAENHTFESVMNVLKDDLKRKIEAELSKKEKSIQEKNLEKVKQIMKIK